MDIISELAMTNSDSLQSANICSTEFTQSSIVRSKQSDAHCQPCNPNTDRKSRLSALNCPNNVTACLRRNFAVFNEGGTIEGVEFKIDLSEGAKPHTLPARHLLHALLPLVKAELNRLCEAGIITKSLNPLQLLRLKRIKR